MVGATPSVQASARAQVSLRVPPGHDAAEATKLLTAHLESRAPWGARVTVEQVGQGQPFRADMTSPAYTAMADAMRDAYPGQEMQSSGMGGSIPLCNTLAGLYPEAEILLIGLSEPEAQIHAVNESVSPRSWSGCRSRRRCSCATTRSRRRSEPPGARCRRRSRRGRPERGAAGPGGVRTRCRTHAARVSSLFFPFLPGPRSAHRHPASRLSTVFRSRARSAQRSRSYRVGGSIPAASASVTNRQPRSSEPGSSSRPASSERSRPPSKRKRSRRIGRAG